MKRIKKFFQKKAVAITTLVVAVIAATNIGILRSGISESFGVGGFFLGTLLITTAVGICGIVKGATMVKDKNNKPVEQKKEAPKFTQQKQQQIGNDSSGYASNFTKSSFDQQKFQQKTDRIINNASEKANRFGIKMGQIFNNQNVNNGFNGNVNNNINNNYNQNYNNGVNNNYNQNYNNNTNNGYNQNNNNVNNNYNRNFNNNVNNNYNRNVNNNANQYNSNNQYNKNVNTRSGSYYYGNSNTNAGYYGNNRGNANNGNNNFNGQNTFYNNASNAYMNGNPGNKNNTYSGNNAYTGNTANRNNNGNNNSRGLDESAQTNYFKNEPGESTYRSGPLKK